MNRITKNIITYSLVGVLQLGLGAATIEASPRHNDRQPPTRSEHRMHEYSYRDGQHDRDRDRRIHEERARHEREMIRREHEHEHEWRERQRLESERHEREMMLLGAALLITILNN
jgi:hypothetical protein